MSPLLRNAMPQGFARPVAIGTTLICPTSKLGSNRGSVIEGGATNTSWAFTETLQDRKIANKVIEIVLLVCITFPVVLNLVFSLVLMS
jgi:hypothetical protein